MFNEDLSTFMSTSFSENAEIFLIESVIEKDFFSETKIQRRLATYPFTINENERDELIIELMEYCWTFPSKSTFKVFRDFEKIFSIIGKRGHFIHQFEVFLLGWNILEHLLSKDSSNIFNKSYPDLFYTWLFISTAHDFGYPMQVADEICDKVSELYKSFNMVNISNKFSEIKGGNDIYNESDFKTIIVYNTNKKKTEEIDIRLFITDGIYMSTKGNKNDAKEIQNYLEKTNNHGYASAAIFTKKYIEYLSKANMWGEQRTYWSIKNIKLIAGAIALHALPLSERNFLEKISFDDNPLAYVLLLVDNIQDWNRTLIPSEEWPSYSLSCIKTNENQIILDYILYHDNWTPKRKNKVKGSLEEKEKIIFSPIKPTSEFGYNVNLNFFLNDGSLLKEINLCI